MSETKTIRIEVCIPCTVELNVRVTIDGEAEVVGGQVVGESKDGYRWVMEHADEETVQRIDELAQKAHDWPRCFDEDPDMDFDTAIHMLDHRGSSDDPIWYKGEETTPSYLHDTILKHDERVHMKAKDVRITYYGGEPLKKRRGGTLLAMVRDRREFHR